MAKERNPKRDQAYALWLKSGGQMTLKEIAAAVGGTYEQVRKWKFRDEWDGPPADKNAEEAEPPKKRRGPPLGSHNAAGHGAPKGNHNAVGHGAPRGNKNSLKHGAFERYAFKYMEPDEVEVAQNTDEPDIRHELLSALAFVKSRELRLLKRIDKIRSIKLSNDQMITSASKTKSELRKGWFTDDEDGHMTRATGGDGYEGEKLDMVVTNTSSTEEALNHLEAELDKVQKQKVKILAQLDSMEIARERLEIERLRAKGESDQSKLAMEWVAALLEVTAEESEGDEDV